MRLFSGATRSYRRYYRLWIQAQRRANLTNNKDDKFVAKRFYRLMSKAYLTVPRLILRERDRITLSYANLLGKRDSKRLKK